MFKVELYIWDELDHSFVAEKPSDVSNFAFDDGCGWTTAGAIMDSCEEMQAEDDHNVYEWDYIGRHDAEHLLKVTYIGKKGE